MLQSPMIKHISKQTFCKIFPDLPLTVNHHDWANVSTVAIVGLIQCLDRTAFSIWADNV